MLRNALLPTIAVVATQTGYLLGGLVIVERAFNYPGMGQEIVNHAVLKDFTVVQAGAMVIGATYLTATVIADIAYSLLNPRIRFGELRMSAAASVFAGRDPDGAPARSSRRETFTRLLRSPTFLIAVARDRLLDVLRVLRLSRRSARPDVPDGRTSCRARTASTRSARIRSARTCSRA